MGMSKTKEEPANSESGETITYVWKVLQTNAFRPVAHVFDFVNNHQLWFSLISRNHKTAVLGFCRERKSRTKELLFLVGFINLKDPAVFMKEPMKNSFVGGYLNFSNFSRTMINISEPVICSAWGLQSWTQRTTLITHRGLMKFLILTQYSSKTSPKSSIRETKFFNTTA